MNRKQALTILPDKIKVHKVNPASLAILLIAPPKWGKTTFFMSNPDNLLLAFESGHRFRAGSKIAIDKWDLKRGTYPIERDADGVPHMTAMQALDLLETIDRTDRYNFITIDTVDMAAKRCVDYHTQVHNIDHISDLKWGKGYELCLSTPMRQFVLGILATGRGVGLLTHTKVEIARFSTGEKAKKEMTLPSQVRLLCESQADIIMHGELGKRRNGHRQRDRILVCEGDDDILAGNRSDALLPERYIVKPGAQWAQFTKFFTDPKAADMAERLYRKSSHRE